MKLLKGLLYATIALVAAALVVGVFLPQTAHVERSITTAASAATIFPLIDGFQHFNEWSPWAQLDPDAKYTFSGPATGVGARMTWTSDKPDVGSGSQEVIAVEPGRQVMSSLDFGPLRLPTLRQYDATRLEATPSTR